MLGLVFYWSLATIAFSASSHLYAFGQAGHSVSMAGAIACCLGGIKFAFSGLNAFEKRSEKKARRKTMRRTSKTYGTSRFGHKNDAKRCGMFKNAGIYLGQIGRQDVTAPPSTVHGCLFAPPGCGKGSRILIPTILLAGLMRGRQNLLIPEFKGETAAVCIPFLRRAGFEIGMVNPFREQMSAELGVDLGDDGFNHLAHLDGASLTIIDDCRLIACLLCPGSGARMSGSEAFFVQFAQDILTLMILWLVYRDIPEKTNLVEVRRLLMLPAHAFAELLDEMFLCDAFNGAIRDYAGKLSATLERAGEEASGGISTAQAAVALFDPHGPLGKHVSRTDGHDFRKLKGKQRRCDFICLPSDRGFTHGPWLQLTMSLATELIGKDRRNAPVQVLYDEFPAAGYSPNILRAMSLYRGSGLRVLLVAQQASQITRTYGKSGLQDILGMSDLVMTFSLRNDWEMLQTLSNLSGQETVRDFGASLRPDQPRMPADTDLSMSGANRGRPIIRPESIRTLSSDAALVFFQNQPVFQVRTKSYWNHPRFRRLAAPNPYYREALET